MRLRCGDPVMIDISLWDRHVNLAGGMYLLVQLDEPYYSGYIKVSSAPLRAAIDQLGR